MVEKGREEKKIVPWIAALSPTAPNFKNQVLSSGWRHIRGMAKKPAGRLQRLMSG